MVFGVGDRSEVIATSALKASEEFSRLWSSVIVVAGYAISFYCLSLVLHTLPIGITYAIRAGLGVVLMGVVGALFYREIPDFSAMLGMGLIVCGVVVINVCSKKRCALIVDNFRVGIG